MAPSLYKEHRRSCHGYWDFSHA